MIFFEFCGEIWCEYSKYFSRKNQWKYCLEIKNVVTSLNKTINNISAVCSYYFLYEIQVCNFFIVDVVCKWKLALSASFSKINFSKCPCQALLIKAMLRNVRNELFSYDIPQVIWAGCIFIENIKIPSIYLQFLLKKLQFTFWGTPGILTISICDMW